MKEYRAAISKVGSGVPTLWRARDVAAVYGVDESTVRRWERSGRVRPARLDPGGSKYWLRHEVVADVLAEPERRAGYELSDGLVDGVVAATRRPRRRREVA